MWNCIEVALENEYVVAIDCWTFIGKAYKNLLKLFMNLSTPDIWLKS